MDIFWGIINLIFAFSFGGTLIIFGVAMYAMANGSPQGPTKSLQIMAISFLILMLVAGLAVWFYLFKNACFYFGWI